MTRRLEISHRFVQFIPRELDEGVLYISERFKTASHLCCCGCGQKVVTPLNPSKWRLQDHDSTVSLSPSVGLGAFPCRSHYWIRRSRVQWCREMSELETAFVQQADRLADQIYTGEKRINEPSFGDFIDRCGRAVAAFVRWLFKR